MLLASYGTLSSGELQTCIYLLLKKTRCIIVAFGATWNMNKGMEAELCGRCPCAQRVVYSQASAVETPEEGEAEADLPG